MVTLDVAAKEVDVAEVDAVVATVGEDENTAEDTADVDTGVGRMEYFEVNTGLLAAFELDTDGMDANWVNVLGSGNGRVDTFEVVTVRLDIVTVETGWVDTVTVDRGRADTIGVDTVWVESCGVNTLATDVGRGVETTGEDADALATADGVDMFKMDVGLVDTSENGERDTKHSGVVISLEVVGILTNGGLLRSGTTGVGALGRTGLTEMGGGRETGWTTTRADGVSGRKSEAELCTPVLLTCCVLLVPGPR
ncbi:hypothetical protein E2C01_012690 [Portunus trituberculatus]|uniref:Uncharacterized protein n=1 Tax=Portunus trituberculatus TaxID=210409 RepID=A0A5B7DET4_PORTR|nr:hypothetical protein [Portunus trituberculatus]